MNKVRFFSALLAFGGSNLAFAQCDAPPMVSVPAGDEATLEQMIEAQTGVRDFMAAMDVYLTCVDEEIEAAGEEATEEYREEMVELYNDGVAQLEELAADFNEARQLFEETASENSEE